MSKSPLTFTTKRKLHEKFSLIRIAAAFEQNEIVVVVVAVVEDQIKNHL